MNIIISVYSLRDSVPILCPGNISEQPVCPIGRPILSQLIDLGEASRAGSRGVVSWSDGEEARWVDHGELSGFGGPTDRTRQRRQLLAIIAIAICAVISGADSWGYVEMFGKSKEEWFRNFLLVRKIAFSCSRKSNQSPDALAPALHRLDVDHP